MSAGPRFYSASSRPDELVLVSELVPWLSHWDPAAGRSRRCGGRDCALCALEVPRQERVVGLALDDAGREWLLEFRDRHRSELERIHALWGSSVGVRLRVRKEGTARNSPVTINALGRESVVERGVTKLVACLGLPAIRASKVEAIEESGEVEVGELFGRTIKRLADDPPLPGH